MANLGELESELNLNFRQIEILLMEDEFPMIIISIIILFTLFYLSYRLLVYAGKKVVSSDIGRGIFSADIKRESSKMTIKIKDWFMWNVQVNNEKGTAGGNIKINFPIKSALGLAIVCLVISVLFSLTGLGAVIIPLIFLSFAIYHFINWYKSVSLIRKSATSEAGNSKQLTRAVHNRYFGGVCQGIHLYFKIPVIFIRALFIITTLIGGIGLIGYILLLVILPSEQVVSAQ